MYSCVSTAQFHMPLCLLCFCMKSYPAVCEDLHACSAGEFGADANRFQRGFNFFFCLIMRSSSNLHTVCQGDPCFLPQASFMYQLQGRYLQNQVQRFKHTDVKVNGWSTVIRNNIDTRLCCGLQGIIWPQVITATIANVCNAIINYVLLFCLDLGVA